jgi:transcriptional regulator with XRE-family HTH domain
MLGQNVRFLLWLRGEPRSRWVQRVSEMTGAGDEAARRLLEAPTASDEVVAALSRSLDVSAEELQFSDFVTDDRKSIFARNLDYLLSGAGKGRKKELAKAIGVNVNTVSSWFTGRGTPRQQNLQSICEYLELPRSLDLLQTPLFLSLAPVSVELKREWLKDRIDALSAHEVSAYFPFLERALGPGG